MPRTAEGYDAILLGYALCGRGTEGLRAGKTQIVLPRAHDCIGLLMGSRSRYQTYFDTHPGVYFRSPGWLENQGPGELLQPANSSKQNTLGERRSREELIAQYGEENGNYLFEQFNLVSPPLLRVDLYLHRSWTGGGLSQSGPGRSRERGMGV